MAIPSTGPISFNDLRTELNSVGSINFSLDNAFFGTYCILPYVNRNTQSGLDIYNVSLNTNDFNLSYWRGYNETEPIYWSYVITNNSGNTYSISVNLGGTNILGNSLPGGNSLDGASSTGVAPVSSSPYTATLTLSVTGTEDVNVVINCSDPDTSTSIYSNSILTPFTNLSLGSIYYYQRFNLDVTIG